MQILYLVGVCASIESVLASSMQYLASSTCGASQNCSSHVLVVSSQKPFPKSVGFQYYSYMGMISALTSLMHVSNDSSDSNYTHLTYINHIIDVCMLFLLYISYTLMKQTSILPAEYAIMHAIEMQDAASNLHLATPLDWVGACFIRL